MRTTPVKKVKGNSDPKQNAEHKREWQKHFSEIKDDFKIYQTLREALNDDTAPDLKVGQKVTFVNDYGVYFENHEILGFCDPEKIGLYGRCVYIDDDSFWFPCHPDSLIVEK